MSNLSLSNMFQYINENKKYLEGYDSVNAGVMNPDRHAHLFKKIERDSFEKAEEMKVLCSENYSDRNVIKGMPEHIIGGKFGQEMKKKIENCMSDYYKGNKTKDEVKEFFRECCTAMRVYCTSNLQTTGYNEKDNQQIIGDIFVVFSKENQRAAVRTNMDEGVEINRKYGGDRGDATRGYAYYNSFYYYECEAMRDIFREMTVEMSEKWEVPEIDTKEIEKNTIYTLDGSLDFNSGWNQQCRNTLGVGSMINQSVAPPKDFKMFFNPTAGVSQWAGILRVEFGGVAIEREVPFDYKGNDIFNVSELIKLTLDDKESQRAINEFLRNFEIFTISYASLTGLNSIRGNHQAKLY